MSIVFPSSLSLCMRSEDRIMRPFEEIHTGVCRFFTEDSPEEGCSSVGIINQMTFHPRVAFAFS